MTNKSTQLLNFFDQSPTAWHAVVNCSRELAKHGFHELKEDELWHLKAGRSYFVTRNGSSLCAFTLPKQAPKSMHVAASHTDSPGFKLKPNAGFTKENMQLIGVEIYGAPLLGSWLNRDLGIAGRVVFTDAKEGLCEELVRLDKHPVVIPQLAIHLDREVNEKGLVLNKQEHLAALVGIGSKKSMDDYIETVLMKALKIKHLLAFDLFLYPLEPARFFGEDDELIASYRIDNLASTYAILQGLLSAKHPHKDRINMAVFWDNEEIGSNTAQGAGSPFSTSCH